ncbi:hypothetical protein B0H14DRAFT_2712105 [Mycena olivaceomarginata]|nr:hypothetical protein B0H14DRAFT_2712105 [Mycena olivaceomarginata]
MTSVVDRTVQARGLSSSDSASTAEGQSSPPVLELRGTSFPSPPRFEVPEDFKVIWLNTKNRTPEGNIFESEKVINGLTDTTSAVIEAGLSSHGVIGFAKDFFADGEVQTVGKRILENVPGIISALEPLTEIHPFLKAVYIPFKYIYQQEVQRRKNDEKRLALFQKIKDVMLLLLELERFGKDDTRTDPEGNPVLGRIAAICDAMNIDIRECYIVLDAQEGNRYFKKFLKAGSWNKVLDSFVSRFTIRHEELTLALNVRSAITIEEINCDVKHMKRMIDMFTTMFSQRDIARWIQDKGDDYRGNMMRYDTELVSVAGPAGRADRNNLGSVSDEQARNTEAKDITILRIESQKDIESIIQEDLERSSKSYELGLYNLTIEGVPAMMSSLETLTEIHPFLMVAYLPFKLVYQQESQRRENDQKRTTLFEKIKDAMLVLLELKHLDKNDTRTDPEGNPVLSRIALICQDMSTDIKEYYNVLDAREKCSLTVRFLKAASWNKELASIATRFMTRREQLVFALSLQSSITMEEMISNMNKMMDMFATMLSQEERDIGRWIQRNGGDKAVLDSDDSCASLIKYEATLVSVVGPAGRAYKSNLGPVSDPEAKKIAALRYEYQKDIQSIIQENLESSSKRLQLGLDNLSGNLANKIYEADRLMAYLQGGPYSRITDPMIYHVWKDQGWRGSANTRDLVLAIRDYFVERVDDAKFQKERLLMQDDDDNDLETVSLPDSWMTAYLQDKRLRYLEQVFDPDSSGLTAISEINAFTRLRPVGWSLPRWISYWAIGWQIFATKYCHEIGELFSQMFLLKQKIRTQMPGNTRYISDYIEGTWPYVTALTSSIERYDSSAPLLEEKFTDYVQSQEEALKGRLEQIQYDIHALETVTLILRGDPIEQSILVLLALLMRRHLAKMHLCLKQELDQRELDDDMDTITWVVTALWRRFVELQECLRHQQIPDLKQTFEWFSCGLVPQYFYCMMWDFDDGKPLQFRNYCKWQHWTSPKYSMGDLTANELKQLDGDKSIQEFVTERLNAVNQRLDEVEMRLTRQLTTVIDMLTAAAQRM